MTTLTSLEGMITATDFAKNNNLSLPLVVRKILDGDFSGGNMDGIWYVDETIKIPSDLNLDSSERSSHKFQTDVNQATRAADVGGALSLINSAIHIIVLIIIGYLLTQAHSYELLSYFFIGAGVLLSWAITYALLSIVVTNALAAKHLIIQTSKL